MRNTSNVGLAQGFMQGYGFMDRMKTSEQSRELRDERNQRAAESHGLSMEINERQLDEYDRQDDVRLVSAVQQGLQSGHLDPEIATEFGERFDVDWNNYTDPAFGESLGVLEGAVQGKVKMNSPEFRKAFSRVFSKEIAKNTGEEYGEEGARSTIKEKRLGGVYPGPDGKSLMVDLQVLEEGPKGASWRSAPVTDNRSASDEYAKMIPLEDALKKLKGHQILFENVQSSPQLKAMLSQIGARIGAEPAQGRWSGLQQVPGVGLVQQGPDGKVEVVQGLDGVKPIVVNDKLVHPETGEVIGDYSSKDPVKGIVVDDQLVDPYTGELIGPGKQGGGKLESSELSQIQQTSRNFHGSFNPDGSFLGIPEGARERYAESMKRSEELVNRGLSLFEATYIANLSTLDPLTPDKAEEIATAEAEEKDLDDDALIRYVDGRTRQLMADQNKAHDAYERIMSEQPQQGMETEPQQSEPAPQEPQAQAPQQTAPPEAIAKLHTMLNSATPDQAKQIKQYFQSTFGYLPEGV